MKKYLFISATLFGLFASQSLQAQGFIIGDAYKSKYAAFVPEDKGFSEDIPASFSLRKYAPTPNNQEGSTCVGWASAYAAMSTQFNFMYGITDQREKDAFAFDPYFLYHQIKGNDNFDCNKGTSMLDALMAMQEYGVKRQLLPAHVVCENNMAPELFSSSLAAAKPFRIKDALIFDLENADTRNTMKYALSIGYPVLIGTNITEQMELDSRTKYGSGVGLWEPNASYKDKLGGHAMCVIGYDDNKFGGAWEVMNSWGTGVGDKGFIWIKYSDFNQIAVAAVVLEQYEFKTTEKSCQIGDCKSGYSRLDLGGGELFEGTFVNGDANGWGYHRLTDGSVYAGPFKDGFKDGKGFYLTADNHWYIVQLEKGTLVDSQALGFSSKTEKTDEIVEASADFLKSYLPLEEGMPNAPALETGGSIKNNKKK